MAGVPSKPFAAGGSLYQTAPLASGTTVLMTGKVHAKDAEPVSWTFTRKDGGKSFYTSLGHKDDFANPAFTTMLTNAVYWAAGKTPVKPAATARNQVEKAALLVWTPTSIEAALPQGQQDYDGPIWFRTGLRVPEWAVKVGFSIETDGTKMQPVWMNGKKRPGCNAGLDYYGWMDSDTHLELGEANLLTIRCDDRASADRFLKHPVGIIVADLHRPERYRTVMTGAWQMQLGDDKSFASIPLPAQFALPPLAYFELPAKRPW
jgi:hypothetical protein